MAKSAALWRCPKCGHRFTSRNLSHSCGRYRLADHFTGRPPIVRQLFDRWRALARACGPITVYAEKTRIVFQARVRFGGAIVHDGWLEGTLWLNRPPEHPCLHRIEPLDRLGCAAHFRLAKPADLDARLARLVRAAYSEHAAAPLAARRRARCRDRDGTRVGSA